MNEKLIKAARTMYGDKYLRDLVKSEVYKPDTRTAVNMGEVRTALHLVPKTILMWLVKNLKAMEKGDQKSLKIPMVSKGVMNVVKHGPDNYTGDLCQDNEKLYDFESRPLPGIGLCILSTFELYDISELKDQKDEDELIDNDKMNSYISEKLESDRLIEAVKSNEMEEKDAKEELIKLKALNALMNSDEEEKEEEKEEDKEDEDKKSKLADFIKKHKKDLVELAFAKSEDAACPSCDSVILHKGEYQGCCCFGEDMYSGLSLVKSENNVNLYRFEKGWNHDNKDRLVRILKDKRNRR